MLITHYDSMSAFADALLPQLLQRELDNNLMISNCARFAQDAQGHYISVSYNGKVVLAAQQVAHLPLVLNALTDDAGATDNMDEAIDALLAPNALFARQLDLDIAVGEANLIARFSKAYAARLNMTARLRMEMGLYQLSVVQMPKQPPPGVFFMCRPTDINLLTAWGERFREDIEGRKLPLPMFRTLLRQEVQQGNVFFWMNDQPVSMACRARATPHIAFINSVYTPPEHRGKGYASACVAALTRYSLVSGYDWCGLYTDLSDITSNNLYQSLGYRRNAVHAEWIFERNEG